MSSNIFKMLNKKVYFFGASGNIVRAKANLNYFPNWSVEAGATAHLSTFSLRLSSLSQSVSSRLGQIY